MSCNSTDSSWVQDQSLQKDQQFQEEEEEIIEDQEEQQQV